MFPEQVYYEPAALGFPLGKALRGRFADIPWVAVDSHNNIPALRAMPNKAFPQLKRLLVVGVRKTHRYVPNHKVSDYLVPYTSSGCSAMCLYCYLVCNYNKCSYLRLFVNREEMMDKLVKTSAQAGRELTFEIGSNSDLVLENTITGNLPWTVGEFARRGRGFLTFPTKFDSIDPLLSADHRGRSIVRMSVNPPEIIRMAEYGTSPLKGRIDAVNRLCDAGYPVGLLIAPVIFIDQWRGSYLALLDTLEAELTPKVRRQVFFEIIFMTYGYVQRAINLEAFPGAPDLFDRERMTGRGRGKYCYRAPLRAEGETFFRGEIEARFGASKIRYIV